MRSRFNTSNVTYALRRSRYQQLSLLFQSPQFIHNILAKLNAHGQAPRYFEPETLQQEIPNFLNDIIKVIDNTITTETFCKKYAKNKGTLLVARFELNKIIQPERIELLKDRASLLIVKNLIDSVCMAINGKKRVVFAPTDIPNAHIVIQKPAITQSQAISSSTTTSAISQAEKLQPPAPSSTKRRTASSGNTQRPVSQLHCDETLSDGSDEEKEETKTTTSGIPPAKRQRKAVAPSKSRH